MNSLLANISGEFVKIAFEDQVKILLKRDSPQRPAARFNRLGENALYLSVNEDSARVAMQKYSDITDAPRVLIRYHVQSCQLFDLRHPDAADMRSLASQDWQEALRKGFEPTSWQMADKLRRDHEIGLIDPSRKNSNLWHITLLRWNEAGAPTVTMMGDPAPITI